MMIYESLESKADYREEHVHRRTHTEHMWGVGAVGRRAGTEPAMERRCSHRQDETQWKGNILPIPLHAEQNPERAVS